MAWTNGRFRRLPIEGIFFHPELGDTKMRLKIKEFERFARERGYWNGVELMEDLGSNARSYYRLVNGERIYSDLVAEIYNRFGDDAVTRLINYGGGGWYG